MSAARYGHKDIAKRLIMAGASIHRANKVSQISKRIYIIMSNFSIFRMGPHH